MGFGKTVMVLGFVLIFGCCDALKAQTKWVKITIVQEQDLAKLAGMGIALEGMQYKSGHFVKLALNETEVDRVVRAGFKVAVEIADLTRFYQQRFDPEYAKDFELGSMGAFTLSQKSFRNWMNFTRSIRS